VRALESAAPGTQPTTLPVEQMYRRADLSKVSLQTTDDLDPVEGIVGQKRAVDAIDFGTRMHQPGFNLFVIGSDGSRMRGAVQSLLKHRVTEEPELSDWVYVNNFADPRKPIAIRLPAGRASHFRDAMRELVLATTSAVHVDRRSLPVTEVGPAELEAILATAGERLVVMSPGADNLFPSRLASELGVPVLVTARGEPLSHSID
jgi:hypothetical protein